MPLLVDESSLEHLKSQRELLLNQDEVATLLADAKIVEKYLLLHADRISVEVGRGAHRGNSETMLEVAQHVAKIAKNMSKELESAVSAWSETVKKAEEEKLAKSRQEA
jgi:hypothetical protein